MSHQKTYENYPAWIVLISNLLSISVYLIGAFIIYKTGLIWLIAYLLYILLLEMRLLKWHCIDCYYFGKNCAFGRGKLSCIFFKKGDAKNFAKREITWKDIVPDFMVTVIPMLVAIAFLIMDFSWLILVLLISIFLLGFIGNGLLRGQLACKYCRQRELGCPAERLFSKKR